ncbi:hypothetical protein RIR_jg32990.t1 [Rhizophagus irregularis DAOM 181602=DAOM 197198]|nr:hypothetical protein RIR_jg32990.t1 [Rhizophagus irregularis DAOM 181602=DAOM 197198]
MICISETLRFGLVSVRLFTESIGALHISIGETLSCIGEALSHPSLCIGIGWDLWSNIGWRGHLDGIGWDFWIGIISIGWREHLDGIGWDFWIGIISWKLGFLNKYRLQPLETKPVVFSFCRSMTFWVFPEWNFEASQLFR